MKNINSLDRLARLFLGVVSLELAFFWLADAWQIAAYAVGAILVLTAAMRFCPIYRVAGVNSCGAGDKTWGNGARALGALLILTDLVGGSYASMFFTRKAFMEEFNAMNHFYKQTLFLTGKNEREKAIANYDQLLPGYKAFQDKYSHYQPFALKGDRQLASDLSRVAEMFLKVGTLVRAGDLHQAHLDLEHVRPVFQEIFKRNGFSLLAVTLIDFHDAMELILDAANAKDTAKTVAIYPQVSEKLKAVEAEANDAEIQAIRKNLEELFALANSHAHDQLPTKAEALKSSFIKVYLKRG
jgi:hypothetical protein